MLSCVCPFALLYLFCAMYASSKTISILAMFCYCHWPLPILSWLLQRTSLIHTFDWWWRQLCHHWTPLQTIWPIAILICLKNTDRICGCSHVIKIFFWAGLCLCFLLCLFLFWNVLSFWRVFSRHILCIHLWVPQGIAPTLLEVWVSWYFLQPLRTSNILSPFACIFSHLLLSNA